jgi:AraC-like DNA-binding protein
MNKEAQDISKPIPLHRVAVVRPFARFLANIGAPVEREFRRAGLPYSALDSVDNYVPSHRFWEFLVKMARSEGIEDLGYRVGEQFGADCADPKMTALLLQAPTLYRGLLKASALINRTVSHCRVGIRQPPNCGYAYFYHRPSCKADNPAIEQIGWFGLETLLGMVRVYTGPQWQPAEIGLMTDHSPCRYIREQFPRARMRLSQAFSYITLENAVLSLPPLHDGDVLPASKLLDYEPLASDFISSLEQVLLAYIQESDLSIELTAELCNTSKRTLQRKLGKMGTRYTEALDHARFRAASHMLGNPGMTVTDVAQRLGYSDVAHFSRAFRRITGVTPKAYREQLSAGSESMH